MDTRVLTPEEVSLPWHLNVPLYQRRYVWDEREQWEPLWADVRRTTELRASGKTTEVYFLGAIVRQALGQQPGQVQQWSVVDGQQRLTMLKLLMDATAAHLEDLGEHRLRKLTNSDEDDVTQPDDLLKLRHSNADHRPAQDAQW